MKSSRRDFCKSTAGVVAGAAVLSGTSLLASCASSDKVLKVGFIGLRNMGYSNLISFMKNENVICAALCDIDSNVLTSRATFVEKKSGIKPKTFENYADLLKEADIDAVMIGTPDHWHCKIAVEAMQQGKHVYVEKPMANSIGEAKMIVEASEKYDKVVQVGQWQRSGQHWQDAVDYLQSGKLGKVSRVKAWSYTSKSALEVTPNIDVPKGVNYDMWLGPAKAVPFSMNRFHYNHRYFWNFAGGLMADWGVHMLDFAIYGLGIDASPKSITATGGKFSYPDDMREVPDILNVNYEFDGFIINWEHAICQGIANYDIASGVVYECEKGLLKLHRGGWEVIPEKTPGKTWKDKKVPEYKIEAVGPIKGSGDLDSHVRNFLSAINNGDDTRASAKVGLNVVKLVQMGNIAYRTGEKLKWDSENDRFINSDKANSYLMAKYRDEYPLPKL